MPYKHARLCTAALRLEVCVVQDLAAYVAVRLPAQAQRSVQSVAAVVQRQLSQRQAAAGPDMESISATLAGLLRDVLGSDIPAHQPFMDVRLSSLPFTAGQIAAKSTWKAGLPEIDAALSGGPIKRSIGVKFFIKNSAALLCRQGLILWGQWSSGMRCLLHLESPFQHLWLLTIPPKRLWHPTSAAS